MPEGSLRLRKPMRGQRTRTAIEYESGDTTAVHLEEHPRRSLSAHSEHRSLLTKEHQGRLPRYAQREMSLLLGDRDFSARTVRLDERISSDECSAFVRRERLIARRNRDTRY